MKDNKFKPQLAPNQETNLDEIKYPLLASYKLDGYRLIIRKGELLTRSLKQLQNKQLREKLEPLRKFTEEQQCTIDGEIYSKEITFQELNKYVMSKDFEDKRSVKRYGKVLTVPDHVKFYAFDAIGTNEDSGDALDVEFEKRFFTMCIDVDEFSDIVEVIKHEFVNDKAEIEKLFEKALEEGEEGLILRDPKGRYKCGRGTIKEGLIYKCKLFVTTDAIVKEVLQATVVDPNAEKKINELGNSITSKKKNDRIPIEEAYGVVVDYNGQDVKVVFSLTKEEKIDVWKNKEKYVGKWIEYKYTETGMKSDGKPRHPNSIRWRTDKD